MVQDTVEVEAFQQNFAALVEELRLHAAKLLIAFLPNLFDLLPRANGVADHGGLKELTALLNENEALQLFAAIRGAESGERLQQEAVGERSSEARPFSVLGVVVNRVDASPVTAENRRKCASVRVLEGPSKRSPTLGSSWVIGSLHLDTAPGNQVFPGLRFGLDTAGKFRARNGLRLCALLGEEFADRRLCHRLR